MLLTEEEAKTKRCQEGYPASDGVTDGPAVIHAVQQAPMVVSMGAGYAASAAAPTAPMHCIGSACMAWRWRYPDPLDQIFTDGSHSQSFSIARGYCGKAGKP